MEFSPEKGSFQETVSLQGHDHPESFAELAVHLEKGQSITYSWAADGEVDFNIHSHRAEEVNYYEKFSGAELRGRFEGPERDRFYLMWQNRSSEPVKVTIQVNP